LNDEDEWMMTDIHALSRILTHGLSVQATRAYASDRAATSGDVLMFFMSMG
jgi:hypothetical protein